jgi:hypothetical protein
MWENRCSWDKRVAPTAAITLKEIFERREIIRSNFIRQKAIKVLENIASSLGKDIINAIVEYLNDEDCCILYMASKEGEEELTPKPFSVNSIPLSNQSSSFIIGIQSFTVFFYILRQLSPLYWV